VTGSDRETEEAEKEIGSVNHNLILVPRHIGSAFPMHEFNASLENKTEERLSGVTDLMTLFLCAFHES
jgi:hypothetical protein